MSEHHRKLEHMYASAPVNQDHEPQLSVQDSRARVTVHADASMHHAAGAVHGALLFKLLDDAAFFAANSIVEDRFVLTADFDVHLLEPVQDGELVAEAEVAHEGSSSVIAEAVVKDEDGHQVARGTGNFITSGPPLDEVQAYRLPEDTQP